MVQWVTTATELETLSSVEIHHMHYIITWCLLNNILAMGNCKKNVPINFTISVSPHVTDEGIFMRFYAVEFHQSLSVRSNFN